MTADLRDADPPPSGWRVPPQPLLPTGELAGTALLREAGPLAPPLWRCLRVVTGWASAAPEARATLFPPELAETLSQEAHAGLPQGAAEPVLAVAAVLRDRPSASDGARLADACATLARWAAEAYMPSAAAEFAAAAAAVEPTSPRHARAAAEDYRRAGRHAEAASMYQRGVMLARLAHDWECYVACHAALGRVAQLRGDHGAARRSLERALRRVARFGGAELRARVLHELFRLEQRTGRLAEAELRGAQAAAAYPPGDPGLRELASEAVAFWLEAGRPEDAHPVLAALAVEPGDGRLRALGALSRTAAALGEESALRDSLEVLLAEPLAQEGRAAALLEAAEGALLLGWLDQAEAAARAALGSATRRDEPGAAAAARSLLTRATARRAVGEAPPARRRGRARGPFSEALETALGAGREPGI